MIKIKSALHSDMQLTQGVNVGSGFSIDDMSIDQAMTYVARKITPWSNQAQIDKDTGNVSDLRSVNPNNMGYN